MNSSRPADTTVGGATALAEKPAAKPQTHLNPVTEGNGSSEPQSYGIPWDELRKKHKLGSHMTHPRDCAA